MRYETKARIATAVLAASLLVTWGLILAKAAQAQALLVGTKIEVPGHVEIVDGPAGIQNGFLRFTTADGKAVLAEVQADGSYKLNFGATIKFSGQSWTPYAGPHAGYIWVMVGDRYLLIPVFNPPQDDRVVRESLR